MPIRTTWRSDGEDREVVTYRDANETSEAWAARHLARLTQKLAEFPPDNT